MLVPSIDLMSGHAVQLVGGDPERLEIDAGVPDSLARRFGRTGEIAVIDLDRALGRGDNDETVRRLIRATPCRVGGGIRNIDTAVRWLDAGAQSIILGTMAKPDILAQLPKDRVMAALDARNGEVVVDGWREKTGLHVLDQIAELRSYVAGFLVTFVEREGRLGGTDFELARKVIEAAGDARVTIAGGVTKAEEIAELDAMGADAQVGMALYSGRLDLTDAFTAPLRSDREDGLIPTVVTDEYDVALGLCYSSVDSIRKAIEEGVGVYQSRSRGLWIKGASSGATQELLAIKVDCDRDALMFRVRQQPPGFCHLNTHSCFGDDRGLPALQRRLDSRRLTAPEGSYTARLFNDPSLLSAKIREEAKELTEAKEKDHIREEAADVLYFTLARLAAEGISLDAVCDTLDQRALKVTRRPGNAKKDIS